MVCGVGGGGNNLRQGVAGSSVAKAVEVYCAGSKSNICGGSNNNHCLGLGDKEQLVC